LIFWQKLPWLLGFRVLASIEPVGNSLIWAIPADFTGTDDQATRISWYLPGNTESGQYCP